MEAFRNIGEVSADLGVRKHVLRFWEARFPQLKPMKRGGGRRYYRPADVQLLRGIRHLLQTAGYTIKGVQKILREGGVEDVKKLGSSQEAHPDSRSRVRPPQSSAVAASMRTAAQRDRDRRVARNRHRVGRREEDAGRRCGACRPPCWPTCQAHGHARVSAHAKSRMQCGHRWQCRCGRASSSPSLR
ncbi:MAG: MerR family transcriptional regulator [Sphingomonadales bacterium]|nr:MerR family transcriptional regulator [Sphingomonadales bacterium]